MQAAANAIDVHNAASRWSKALLDNAARPSGAIVYRGAEGQAQLSQDQYDRLVSEMENLDLSRFSAAPSARLSHLAFESDGAFPTQC